MKIAISGAHSQGKTTLINDLKNSGEVKQFKILDNITRGIKDLGIPICEAGSDWSQLLVTNKHIEHYFTKGDCLLDRCMLDGIAYTYVLYRQAKISQWAYDYVRRVADELLRKGDGYDIIFYVKPELPLADDGVRTIDKDFFDRVVKAFEGEIYINNLNVVVLSGSREQRVGTVINSIAQFSK